VAKLNAPASPRLHAVDLEDVSVRFGRHWALDAATIHIEAGQRWLLLGANGAGKTVLLKLLCGDLWPTPTGRGHRQYRGKDGTYLHTAAARERIAYLGPERQDKYERYQWNSTVAAVVGTGFADTDLPLDCLTAAQSRRVVHALGEVGLRGLARRRFLTLSYGQRRRVLLARSLMRRPDLLLLDEALNGLDRRSRTVFLRVLQRFLPASTAWVLSSHRPLGRATGATHVARIDRGRIVSSGPLERRSAARVGSQPAALSRARSRGGVGLKLANVTVYRDYRPVLACLDLEVREGEHWAVVGPNGSGSRH
jgi:ABC-type molybdenum transport system ATPase subunit/photorepair protein PhrA